MEYALKRSTDADFERTAEAVEEALEAHGFAIVGVNDIHLTVAAKGFRVQPVRVYEVRDAEGLREFQATRRLPRAALASGRVSVFVEGDEVYVAALRPAVVSQMFPEAGLDEEAKRVEERLVEALNEALASLGG
ncbi:MAG: hypothetical protein Kow0056_05080 [Coriobacteriia bacterium]